MDNSQTPRQIDYLASTIEKKNASVAMFDDISELLFDRVNLINSGFATAGGTTSTTTYDIDLRVIDTSERKFMRPDRKLRFRGTFYTSGTQAQVDAYILTPAIYNSLVAPTLVTDLSAYVGLKIDAGIVSLVSKNTFGEKTVPTSLDISDGATYYLEVKYNINNAEFYIDGEYLGSITCNLNDQIYNYLTFYPLIAPIRSKSGSSVNINFESYQILQDK